MNRQWPWLGYYWQLRHIPPRGTALKSIALLEPGSTDKPVIDLGAGHGPDTLAFLRAGHRVVAVEPNPVALFLTRCRAIMAGQHRNLKCIQSDFTEIPWPPCKAINASFSLPFCPASHWPEMWQSLVNALPQGGVFSGQFFGLQDTWAQTPLKNRPSLHFSQKQVQRLFYGFDILHWKEVMEPGRDPHGSPKNWHVYHVVAKKG